MTRANVDSLAIFDDVARIGVGESNHRHVIDHYETTPGRNDSARPVSMCNRVMTYGALIHYDPASAMRRNVMRWRACPECWREVLARMPNG